MERFHAVFLIGKITEETTGCVRKKMNLRRGLGNDKKKLIEQDINKYAQLEGKREIMESWQIKKQVTKVKQRNLAWKMEYAARSGVTLRTIFMGVTSKCFI